MNTLRFSLSLVAAFTALSSTAVLAQSGSGTMVAVLDVGKVFKGHLGFTRQMEAMKADVKAFEADIQSKRQILVDQAKQLNQYKQGSSEYRQLEAKLAKEQSDLQVRMGLKRKGFIEREAKMFYATYQEIVAAVAMISEQYRINLVLRYNSEEIDPDNPGGVKNALNRYVIWQKNLDITKIVVKQVNDPQAMRLRPKQ